MNANLIVKLTQLIVHSTVGTDDLADTLNNKCTGVIMVFFVGVLFIKQYIMKPIQCWVPQEFSKAWEEYSEYYCWVADTYFVPVAEQLPNIHKDRMDRRLGYYQWVPFVLLLQCTAFYIPYCFWHLFARRSGLNLNDLLKCASEASTADPEHRQKIVAYVARYMEECFHHNRQYSNGAFSRLIKCLSRYLPCVVFGKRLGNYLTALYLFVKLMYIGNLLGQIYLIGVFTGTTYTFYGVELLTDIIRGRQWEQSGLFPRVTWCDFQVWSIGNLHTYSVQCVLPINLFNEKIFIFLWFWFLFVLAFTVMSLVNWMLKLVISRNRQKFICKFLRLMENMSRGDKKLAHKFVDGVLRYDGVFTIHLLADRAGEIVSGEVVCFMWLSFKDKLSRNTNLINNNKLGGSSNRLAAMASNYKNADGDLLKHGKTEFS